MAGRKQCCNIRDRKEVDMTQEKTNGAQSSAVFAPTVGASYSNGWRQMWRYFLELFLIGLLALVIGIPSGASGWSGGGAAGGGVAVLGVLAFVYSLLIVNPVDYGVSFAHLKAARSDRLEIKDMFESFRNYWNVVLANILVGAIVVIGFILLIVPGIIFACKLAFTPYLVVDRKMEVLEAVRESWRMTSGHAGTVFLIGLLSIPIFIAGLICFGVGIIVSIMWIRVTFASLYHSVSVSGGASS